MDKEMEAPEVELARFVVEEVDRSGLLSAEHARALGQRCAERLVDLLGGTLVYMGKPMGTVIRLIVEEEGRRTELLTLDQLRPIGFACESRWVREFRGQQVYVRGKSGAAIEERNAQIRADFNGTNHSMLAKKYSISTRQIYEIVKRGSKNEQ